MEDITKEFKIGARVCLDIDRNVPIADMPDTEWLVTKIQGDDVYCLTYHEKYGYQFAIIDKSLLQVY